MTALRIIEDYRRHRRQSGDGDSLGRDTVPSDNLLLVSAQEVADPSDGLLQIVHPWQGHHAEVVRPRPVEGRALDDQQFSDNSRSRTNFSSLWIGQTFGSILGKAYSAPMGLTQLTRECR